jgi:hypothetical protein
MADHVELMVEGVRKAGGDVSTVARHLESIDYLTPSEGARLKLALAHASEQVQRARTRVDAIEGSDE